MGASANADRVQVVQGVATSLFNENNPLTQREQKKLENAASKVLTDYSNKAQIAAESYGIELNFDKIAKKLKENYQDDVKSALKDARKFANEKISDGETQLDSEEVQNKIKKAKQQANRMNFGG